MSKSHYFLLKTKKFQFSLFLFLFTFKLESGRPISIELTAADENGIVHVFFNSEDVNFQVKEINIRCKNAKEIIILTKSEQNGEEQVIQTKVRITNNYHKEKAFKLLFFDNISIISKTISKTFFYEFRKYMIHLLKLM